MLSKEKMEEIYEIHREMQNKFKATNPKGELITYLEKEFIVYPSVFHPSLDSMALVQSFNISKGDKVLDLCTGSGVIAIFSALKGASKVIALDINPQAIKCVKENAKRHNVEEIIDAKVSDMFSALENPEKYLNMFDVITINPPFTPHIAKTYEERTMWDQDLNVHKVFFRNLDKYLAKNGRAYISHAAFGAVDEMKEMAIKADFKVTLLSKKKIDDIRTFFAFELTRNIIL